MPPSVTEFFFYTHGFVDNPGCKYCKTERWK